MKMSMKPAIFCSWIIHENVHELVHDIFNSDP